MTAILINKYLSTSVNQLENDWSYPRHGSKSAWPGRSIMKPPTASETVRRPRCLSRPGADGGATVAWAAAAPLVVLAAAVLVDHAQVSRFRTQVELAAGAASLASAAVAARHPEGAGDGVASRVASVVFARNAPRGASGTPTVAATSRGAVVTATVTYEGVAPSNFGSALGYGAFRVSVSATSPALIADSQAAATP
jgi:Flp pilus assembly protein TadG